mmetsp:Transcript_22513/g.49044  ORF Transcript_22513/g.49044 Transcript_22513/m.49044 type:complete len:278 (-) Transcript_22513:1001-1834(-)
MSAAGAGLAFLLFQLFLDALLDLGRHALSFGCRQVSQIHAGHGLLCGLHGGPCGDHGLPVVEISIFLWWFIWIEANVVWVDVVVVIVVLRRCGLCRSLSQFRHLVVLFLVVFVVFFVVFFFLFHNRNSVTSRLVRHRVVALKIVQFQMLRIRDPAAAGLEFGVQSRGCRVVVVVVVAIIAIPHDIVPRRALHRFGWNVTLQLLGKESLQAMQITFVQFLGIGVRRGNHLGKINERDNGFGFAIGQSFGGFGQSFGQRSGVLFFQRLFPRRFGQGPGR